ncbi:FecR domain-containing protein [Mucilaginibacter gynuensis]|uniref:FecR domain-containing protein n=1 Tax=Mucilaginibacter gynuensis TaxID=1302236 RepID=A0ABP8GAW4_9SPHI
MKPPQLKKLIDRYLKNNVTDKERQLVDEWYQSYEGDKNALSAEKEARLKKEIYRHVKGQIDTPSAKIRWLNITRYAAAAVTILLISVGLLFRKKAAEHSNKEAYTIIKTGTGQVRKLQLPDGSTVWLNAMSSIRVSEDFENKTFRNIYLDEGEAFFEVKKNPARPFLVITRNITTRVLGTSFNVKAYNKLNNATVTVRTGRVQVNDKQRQLAVLLPDQKIIYSIKDHTSIMVTGDGGKSKAWTDGQTILNQASFKELALAFKSLYGVQLTSKNKLTTSYKYNVTISSSHTVDQAMKIICSVHQNTFRRKNNEVIIY